MKLVVAAVSDKEEVVVPVVEHDWNQGGARMVPLDQVIVFLGKTR